MRGIGGQVEHRAINLLLDSGLNCKVKCRNRKNNWFKIQFSMIEHYKRIKGLLCEFMENYSDFVVPISIPILISSHPHVRY